ncbi:MAG: hypothetical protein ABIH01_03745, partial [Candidatus Omnitrophota bacterium]
FIDGNAHGTNQTYGFFVTADPTANINSPGTADLKYSLDYCSVSLCGIYPALNSERLELSLVSGPVYARFSQQYKVSTVGTNAAFGNATTSETEEKLIDHLFGGRMGLRAKIPCTKRLDLSLSQMVDLFFRSTYFKGEQEINNAAGVTAGPTVFTSYSDTIATRKYDSYFVPRFSTKASLAYNITEWMSVSFFYNFDTWLNLSRIENSVVTADLAAIRNKPTAIEKETVLSHALGGKLTIKF